jgi:hypothetical protein
VAKNPEIVVIKKFTQRMDLRRDWEGAEQLLNQLAEFALDMNIFILLPLVFIE